MTDKNRDFSQIRVGKPVAADRPPPKWGMVAGQMYRVESLDRDATGTVYVTIRVSDLSRVVFYEDEWGDMGGYIVSQPEEQSAPDQASMRTREEQIADVFDRHLSDDTEAMISKGALRLMLEFAEKRGAAAGYECRVAEEGGEPIAYVNLERLKWKLSTGDSVCLTFSASPVTEGRPNHQLTNPIYAAPIPTPETIKELRLSEMHARADAEAAKAKVATLRDALAALVSEFGCTLELYDRNGPSLSCADGEFIHASAIYDRREALGHATEALAATEDE